MADHFPLSTYGTSPEAIANGVRTALSVITSLVKSVESVQERRTKDSPAERDARSLYWEVLYNLIVLGEGQRSDPPVLLVSSRMWDTEHVSSAIAQVMERDKLPLIIGAYVQLNTYEWVFSRGWTSLARLRLEGGDQELLEQLRQNFLGAEGALRDRLFETEQAQRLAEAVGKLSAPARKPWYRRAHSVVLAVPPKVVWGSLAAWGVWQLYRMERNHHS